MRLKCVSVCFESCLLSIDLEVINQAAIGAVSLFPAAYSIPFAFFTFSFIFSRTVHFVLQMPVKSMLPLFRPKLCFSFFFPFSLLFTATVNFFFYFDESFFPLVIIILLPPGYSGGEGGGG